MDEGQSYALSTRFTKYAYAAHVIQNVITASAGRALLNTCMRLVKIMAQPLWKLSPCLCLLV